MRQIIKLFVTLITISLLPCNTTSPFTDLIELTIHLSTSGDADVIVGEFVLQNNFDNSQLHRSFAFTENLLTDHDIETIWLQHQEKIGNLNL